MKFALLLVTLFLATLPLPDAFSSGEAIILDADTAASSGASAQMEGPALVLKAQANQPITIPLARITAPSHLRPHYALTGEVRYANVEGDGYLEMWNYFQDTPTGYFSRTLGTIGPMSKLTGSSAWREFILPFDSQGAPGPLTRLEFNLVLPARGEVAVRGVKLIEFPVGTSPQEAAAGKKAWWSERQAGWIGGIAGTAFGLLGAVMGLSASRWPRFAIRCGIVVGALGIVSLIGGCLAIATSQPFPVYYPLLLIGVIAPGVCGINTLFLVRRMRREELRRISAMDAEAEG